MILQDFAADARGNPGAGRATSSNVKSMLDYSCLTPEARMNSGVLFMIELSEPQQQALAQHPNEPLQVIDPATRRAFVLLDAGQYERLLQAFALGPLTADERRLILSGVWRRAGWDDPRMDAYDQLDRAPSP
jgi:hypothetical protein